MELRNINTENFGNPTGENFKDPNLFNPDPAKGQNNIYKAGIRFLPWWKDSTKSMYRKYQAILTHPFTKDKFFVECPSTLRQPSILWDLDTLLRNKVKQKVDEKIVAEIKMNFNRYYNVFSPVYIITDLQDATLNYKIKIYAYGSTIAKKIEKLMEPDQIGNMPGVKKINPYSLIEGKDFMVIVKKKTKQYKDYDDCKFVDQVSPFVFMYNGTQYVVDNAMLDATAASNDTPLAKFLSECTPDLEQYYFKPWTLDIREKVADHMVAIIQYPNIMQELLSFTKDLETKSIILRKLKERAAIADSYNIAGGMHGIPQGSTPGMDFNIPTPTPTNEGSTFVFDKPQYNTSTVNPPVIPPVIPPVNAPSITGTPIDAPLPQKVLSFEEQLKATGNDLGAQGTGDVPPTNPPVIPPVIPQVVPPVVPQIVSQVVSQPTTTPTLPLENQAFKTMLDSL